MSNDRVVIIGAGIGGLASAIALAARGMAVEVIERAATSGGKMRQSFVDGSAIDAGPTVFTMRWVFDELFKAAGASFEGAVTLQPLDILARHAWDADTRLDLFADLDRATDAIAAFAGPGEARHYRAFCADAANIYRTLERPFLASPRPNPLSLSRRIGLHRPDRLFAIRPFETLWSALGKYFTDPRLRQLFGRYATYSGSSPFAAPATLMLIAHVEQAGVWAVAGGMQQIAFAMETLARRLGVAFRFEASAREIIVANGRAAGVVLASGERIDARAVVLNADVAALGAGLFGAAPARAISAPPPHARSLSAVTWAMSAVTQGFPLHRHNVFFSDDYAAEFDQLFVRQRLAPRPTVYLCAQDRGGGAEPAAGTPERLLMLVNAPASGDRHPFEAREIDECETSVLALLARCGLKLTMRMETAVRTTPQAFHRLFPATGGALYGMASHGWAASFQRPAANTRLPSLYLAGGGTHPGAGVPMAALSGRLAAERLLADRASTRSFLPVAISGGTLMA